jgi:hypothetical protein
MRPLSACFAIALVACGDGGTNNENELITTMTLTFTPGALGTTEVAVFDDPDGDGGEPPSVDTIELVEATYQLAVTFENRLADPPEDVTEEVADEAEEHQVFLKGPAVGGPASDEVAPILSHRYEDEDANGLPIGLSNTIFAGTFGGGTNEMTVTLRHLPPVNGQPTKTADTADMVRESGLSSIGGTSDVQVTFTVTVQ